MDSLKAKTPIGSKSLWGQANIRILLKKCNFTVKFFYMKNLYLSERE